MTARRRGVWVVTPPLARKRALNLRFRVCAQPPLNNEFLGTREGRPRGVRATPHPLAINAALLALAGATLLLASSEAAGKAAKARRWWEAKADGVELGTCPYCWHRILRGMSEGIPVALELLPLTLEQEVYMARQGVPSYWLLLRQGAKRRHYAYLRDQFNVKKQPRPLVVPVHQCPDPRGRKG